MKDFMGRGARRGGAGSVAVALAALVLLGSCGAREGDRYAAEKELFKARALGEQAAAGSMRPEFLAGAVDAYRSLVSEYAPAAASSEDVEAIVVAAQMELAELEFRGMMLQEARNDFERLIDIAGAFPPVRASALFSAGAVSEELGEIESAARHYERFYREFLASDSIAPAARMNPRYLSVPLRLADLATRAGRAEDAERWYRRAETTYGRLIAAETEPTLLKEARFNLLAVHLQRKNWERGLALSRELRALYPQPQDESSTLFIEAKILDDGLARASEARATYLSIAERFPREREAAAALLAAALIDRRAGRLGAARAAYERIIDSYGDRANEAAEAAWQLAEMEEGAGRWEEASLRYKTIYANYPETLRGFEAPLRGARAYAAKGAADAAKAAYDRALEHYEKLAGEQRRESTRIIAEDYAVRVLAERKRWREAAERLLKLPDRYPAYAPLRENYLRAAAIHERELADSEGAARILETCVAKYPETELAKTAGRELARLRGGRR